MKFPYYACLFTKTCKEAGEALVKSKSIGEALSSAANSWQSGLMFVPKTIVPETDSEPLKGDQHAYILRKLVGSEPLFRGDIVFLPSGGIGEVIGVPGDELSDRVDQDYSEIVPKLSYWVECTNREAKAPTGSYYDSRRWGPFSHSSLHRVVYRVSFQGGELISHDKVITGNVSDKLNEPFIEVELEKILKTLREEKNP